MIVTKCHSMGKVNTENLSLIYFLLICHRMVRNKCPPFKKTLWPENYDKGKKKLVVSWSITFACSKGRIKLIVHKSCGELSLAV